jgi:hypothetical protein
LLQACEPFAQRLLKALGTVSFGCRDMSQHTVVPCHFPDESHIGKAPDGQLSKVGTAEGMNILLQVLAALAFFAAKFAGKPIDRDYANQLDEVFNFG